MQLLRPPSTAPHPWFSFQTVPRTLHLKSECGSESAGCPDTTQSPKPPGQKFWILTQNLDFYPVPRWGRCCLCGPRLGKHCTPAITLQQMGVLSHRRKPFGIYRIKPNRQAGNADTLDFPGRLSLSTRLSFRHSQRFPLLPPLCLGLSHFQILHIPSSAWSPSLLLLYWVRLPLIRQDAA